LEEARRELREANEALVERRRMEEAGRPAKFSTSTQDLIAVRNAYRAEIMKLENLERGVESDSIETG
jgi:hypothetical protein